MTKLSLALLALAACTDSAGPHDDIGSCDSSWDAVSGSNWDGQCERACRVMPDNYAPGTSTSVCKPAVNPTDGEYSLGCSTTIIADGIEGCCVASAVPRRTIRFYECE